MKPTEYDVIALEDFQFWLYVAIKLHSLNAEIDCYGFEIIL